MGVPMLKLSTALVLMLCFSSPVFAYCSEPSAPFCATSYSEFQDQDEFDRCKREMEYYQGEVEDHFQCLQRDLNQTISDATNEAKRKAETASSEYSDAIDSFNRRANQ